MNESGTNEEANHTFFVFNMACIGACECNGIPFI